MNITDIGNLVSRGQD